MLTEKEITFLRKELESAQNPLYFYDSDPDGLCSFLLLYKKYKEGKGIILAGAPTVDKRFLRKVRELEPDKIVVLDKHKIEDEFVQAVKQPIFWIDHHDVIPTTVHYFNPKKQDPTAYIPTSRMAYQVAPEEVNLWIAMVGCLADYYLPDFTEKFSEMYPWLLSKPADLDTMLYRRPVGKLVRVISFLLKGPTLEVKKSIAILTKLSGPEEIMHQTTAQGKFLWKRFLHINKRYEEIITQIRKNVTSSKLLVYTYGSERWSFTADLANELKSRYPKKVIIIARKKDNEYRCSLRARFPINKAIERALVGIDGYGGGHPQACGAGIKAHCWEQFLENLRRELP